MEFFEGWKALNSRLDNSDLPALTQLVALKLFVISDERRFPVSISVPDRELMQRTGIPSKHTIHDARLRLKRAGLIEFTTQPHKPTQYRWTLDQGNTEGTLREHLGNDKGTLEADSYIRVRDRR